MKKIWPLSYILKSLDDRDYVLVDTETSGSSPVYNQIIEVGIIRASKGKVVDQYSTFIKPSGPISGTIKGITGITDLQLSKAPTFQDIAEEILEKLDGAVFVAHNARFDYGFFKNEFKRAGLQFNAKTLCMVKLSRRLYPQKPSHSLDAIIEDFNIVCKNRHRAFDDALVMAHFLRKSEIALGAEFVKEHIAHCLKEYTVPANLSRNMVSALPNSPGVYLFYGIENELLYVGKSIDIKARVMSHFSGDHSSSKELQMCNEVHTIEAKITSGELSALFLESYLIKTLRPLYNRKLRRLKKLCCIREEINKDGYKTMVLSNEIEIETHTLATLRGVFRSVSKAKQYLQTNTKEFKLCPKIMNLEKSSGGCFYLQLESCLGACISKESALTYNMRFDQAFRDKQIKSWPFKGPILVKESIDEESGVAYAIDCWCIIKKIEFNLDYQEEHEVDNVLFDFDSYKILSNHMLKPSVRKTIIPYISQDLYDMVQ